MQTLTSIGITEITHPKFYPTFKLIEDLYDTLSYLENVTTTKLQNLCEKLRSILKNNVTSEDAVLYWDSTIKMQDLRKPRMYIYFTPEIQNKCKSILTTLLGTVHRFRERGVIREVEIHNIKNIRYKYK